MDHMKYHSIIASIDEVAQAAENKGLLREASDLDIIANTLEKEAGLTDALKKGLDALKKGIQKIPGASNLLNKLKGKTTEDIIKYLIKGIGEVSEEDFKAFSEAAMSTNSNSRNAALNARVIMGAVLLLIFAGMANKSVAGMTHEDWSNSYKRSIQEFAQEAQADKRGWGITDTKEWTTEDDRNAFIDSVANKHIEQIKKALKQGGARIFVDGGMVAVISGMDKQLMGYMKRNIKEGRVTAEVVKTMLKKSLLAVYQEDGKSTEVIRNGFGDDIKGTLDKVLDDVVAKALQ